MTHPESPVQPARDQEIAQFRAILRSNDRGGYAVPSSRLYPFQWNWDAAINAVGWQTFDEDRAWQEVESLLAGQWDNGMVPSIVFHKPAQSYFPGPQEWGCDDRQPPTTSISQPPVLATMVRRMRARSVDPAVDARLAPIVARLVRWHRWWHRDRDPLHTGLVVTYHPWETGSDNSPAWDEPLKAVPPTARAYQRRDTGVVDGSMRPHKAEYDRFVYLVDFFRDCGFDARKIYDGSPFRIVDFALNAILLRADADLAVLCDDLGMRDEAGELRACHARSLAAIDSLWCDALGRHVSLDTRNGRRLEQHTHAAYLAWYANLFQRAGGTARSAALQGGLEDLLQSTRFGLASTHPRDPGFDPRRYWRGSVWPHINWLVAEGLSEQGLPVAARRLRDDTLALVRAAGPFEYFSPDSGEGLGGPDFSWTASIALILLAGSGSGVSQGAACA